MQNHNGRRAVCFGIAALLWVGVLFFFSGQSGEESGALSGSVTELLFGWLIDLGADARMLELLLRKGAHMTIFAIEGFLMGMSLLHAMRRRSALAATAAGCAVMAVLNELHQLTSAGRSCSVIDMLIDSSGALLGLLASAAVLHAFSSKNKNITGD